MPEGDPKFLAAQEQAQLFIAQAAQMRQFEPPPEAAGPAEVHSALVKVRGQLDRLETILVTAITVRDAAQARARSLEQAADDAWDGQATSAPHGRRHEFEGAQERYAIWRLRVRPQRNEARVARDCADVLVSAERAVQVMYRGLDSSRQDLHRRISALAFISALES